MKRKYVSPALEVYSYLAEEGYATTVALHKDYVLIEGNNQDVLRASEEFAEVTEEDGEYVGGGWTIDPNIL